MAGDKKFYAVRAGHVPGVYTKWDECLSQITGFKGAKFKSFTTQEDANLFVRGQDPPPDPSSSSYTTKFYGVRSGKVPGVYTDWAEAEKQIKGVSKPKVKGFSTHEEAEAFVKGMPVPPGAATKEDRKRPSRPVAETRQNAQAATTVPPPALSSDGPPAPKRRRSQGTGPSKEAGECTSTPVVALTAQTSVIEKEQAEEKKPKSRTTAKKNNVLRIYTDGSALANGRSAAQAGVGVWFGDQDTRNISEPLAGPRQTNQRAELTAILRALNVGPLDRDVLIFTDSQYAINCVTVWYRNWVKQNWITSVGRPVENQDLIEQILAKVEERQNCGGQTKFEWVKGHSGLKDGNAEADRLAVEGAMMARVAQL